MGEAEHPHAEPAELDMDVGTGGQLADLPAPFGENLVALAGIRAEADRATDMVEHDRRLGEGAGQVDQLAKLGVVHPGVKAETERRKSGEALAHPRVQQ